MFVIAKDRNDSVAEFVSSVNEWREMEMFVGKSAQTVGRDGRMYIPSKMLDVIRTKYDENDLYFVLMPEGIICIYPEEEFKKVIEKLSNPQEASLSDTMCIQRICAEAEICKPDKYGRIMLPYLMRDKAHIEHDILIIGAMDHIEIWDPRRWEYNSYRARIFRG